MPRVPEYGQPQVREAPLPSTRVPANRQPEEFGAGLGEGISRIGAGALDLYQQEKQRADQLAGQDYELSLSELQVQQEAKLRKSKGKDSLGVMDQVFEEFDKLSGEWIDSLSNETQKGAARRMKSLRMLSLKESGEKYVSEQLTAYDNVATESLLKNLRNEAALNADDSGRVTVSITKQQAAITDYVARNGLPPERREEMITAAVSATHVGVMEQLIANGSYRQATQYLAAHHNEIPADNRLTFQAKLKEGATNEVADQISHNILTKMMPADMTTPMNEFDVMQDVRKRTSDANVIKSAQGMVQQFVSNFNERGKQILDGRKQSVYKSAAAGVPVQDIYKSPEYLGMPGVDQEAFKTHMTAKANKPDEEVRLEQATRWGDLISNPELLRTTDLNQELVEKKIDKAQYAGLVKAKEQQDPMKADAAKNAIAMIDRGATQHLFNPSNAAKNLEEWTKSKNILQAYIQNNWLNPDYDPNEFSIKLMKPIEETWVQSVIDTFLPGRPVFNAALDEMKEQKRRELEITAGPDPKRQHAIDTLTKAGKPVTEPNIKFLMDRTP